MPVHCYCLRTFHFIPVDFFASVIIVASLWCCTYQLCDLDSRQLVIVSIFDQPSTICWQLGLQFGNCSWQTSCSLDLHILAYCNLDRPILVHPLCCRSSPIFAELCRSGADLYPPVLCSYFKTIPSFAFVFTSAAFLHIFPPRLRAGVVASHVPTKFRSYLNFLLLRSVCERRVGSVWQQ